MAKRPKLEDRFWPLGGVSYASEVHDFFPEEAAILGSITILWNRHEILLRRLFIELLNAATDSLAEAIWDRQSTHQNRRELLALTADHAGLTDRQRDIMRWVIDHTKTMADRRNDLIHAEYVVSHRTEVLHGKVKSPRSTKPAKHQKLSVADLKTIERDLEHLIQATEGGRMEMPRGLALQAKFGPRLAELAKELKSKRE